MSWNVEIDVVETPGWRLFDVATGRLWLKGYLFEKSPEDLGNVLRGLSVSSLPSFIDGLDGHFAFVWQDTDKVVASEDPIGSIPLSFRQYQGGRVKLSGTGRRLLRDSDRPDPTMATVMAMAGFTLGETTLYPMVRPVGAGRFLCITEESGVEHRRYHDYIPSNPDEDPDAYLEPLQDLTLSILEKTVQSIDGRTIVVPLSAGLDSRLIVSGLAELGYRKVVCISYGRTGNHEAVAASKIAEKLGYDWHFIAHTPAQQSKTFASKDCAEFLSGLADNLQAAPFQQDFHAVGEVQNRGIAPRDSIFINGQSGDFIAGNHIPRSLITQEKSLFDAFAEKHFGMWNCLKTADNTAMLRCLFEQEIAQKQVSVAETVPDFALFEALEYENRQSKYVVAGQRTYEWFGYDWRLPLWDRAYIDFWRSVPLAGKLGQSLYKAMLHKANWGGVWGPEWVFPQTVVPAWMRPVRFAAKALHAPLGRKAWHRFEKNWIAWYTDAVSNYAVADYTTVRQDRRGHRNAISWHLDRYLREKGVQIKQDGVKVTP